MFLDSALILMNNNQTMIDTASKHTLLAHESKTVFYHRQRIYQQNKKKKRFVLQDHAIQHWQNWLTETAERLPNSPDPISSFSAQWLWLDAAPATLQRFDDDALNLALWRHYEQAQHHQIPIEVFKNDPDPLMQRLAETWDVFQSKLVNHQLACDTDLLKLFQEDSSIQPEIIDEYRCTPLQKTIFSTNPPKIQSPKHQSKIIHFVDETSALLHLDRLIQTWVAQNKYAAIITPHVDALLSAFQTLPETSKWLPKIDFGTAMSLSDHPAVAIPLSLLSCDWPWIKTVDIRTTIFHPIFSETINEEHCRILLESKEPYVHLEKIPNHWKDIPLIQTLLSLYNMIDDKHHPFDWMEHIINAFAPVKWPQNLQNDSQAERALSKWFNHMEALMVLPLGQKLDLEAFVHRLKLITRSLYHQPQHQPKNVVVLRPEEAFSLTFDECFFYDLHPQSWPPNPRISSLFPLSIQKKIHPDLMQSHTEATKYFQTLARQTAHSTVALVDRDDHRPHSYDLPGDRTHPEIIENKLSVRAAKRHRFTNHPSIPYKDKPKVSTYTLKYQAECPFKAFALQRLDASSITEPTFGLDPMEKGELIHQILETILRENPQRETLSEKILSESIHAHLDQWKRFRPISLNEPFRTVEHKRIFNLLKEWLTHENSLPAAHSRQLESAHQYQCTNATIRARIDRIDYNNAKHAFVMDYKTSQPTSKYWFTERLCEPQLPLYSLVLEDTVSVCFYQINHQSICLKGVQQINGKLKGIGITIPKSLQDRSWEEQLLIWKDQIDELATEHQMGLYTVSPQPQACQTCHLSGLCRIHDWGLHHETH